MNNSMVKMWVGIGTLVASSVFVKFVIQGMLSPIIELQKTLS